jgi:hypothetical protein
MPASNTPKRVSAEPAASNVPEGAALGTVHALAMRRRHLPCYFDEFTFRFNRRTSKARGMLFYRLLQQAS